MKLLLIALLSFLSENTSAQTYHLKKKSGQKWKGKWERNSWQNSGELEIKSFKNGIIKFYLLAESGGHSGEIEDSIRVSSNSAKYYKQSSFDTCIIEFKLKGNSVIVVNQKKGNCGTGMGVDFTGNYYSSKIAAKKGKLEGSMTLFKLGIFSNKKDDDLFRQLTKKYYELFLNSTQLTSEDEDSDSLHAKVFSSGVRGLFTEMENIIIIDSNKNIWAAVIDNSGKKDVLLYFTNRNDYANKLPKTIDRWRINFKNYPVIYKSNK